MDKYYFLYKNLDNPWCVAINPVFIAKHKYCRAISKEVVTDLGYDKISDFVNDLNKGDYINDKYNATIYEWELY